MGEGDKGQRACSATTPCRVCTSPHLFVPSALTSCSFVADPRCRPCRVRTSPRSFIPPCTCSYPPGLPCARSFPPTLAFATLPGLLVPVHCPPSWHLHSPPLPWFVITGPPSHWPPGSRRWCCHAAAAIVVALPLPLLLLRHCHCRHHYV